MQCNAMHGAHDSRLVTYLAYLIYKLIDTLAPESKGTKELSFLLLLLTKVR